MIRHDCETGSLEWHQLHLGIPTAGAFSRILTPKGAKSGGKGARTYMGELVHQRFTGRRPPDIGYVPSIRAGLDREPQSLARHEMMHGVVVQHAGFVLHDSGRWGATPDGLAFRNDPTPLYNVEAKNPGPGAFIQYAYQPGALEDSYRAQVTGQMLATGVERTVLLAADPDLETIETVIELDHDYAELLLKALEEFCDELDEMTTYFERERGWTRVHELHPEWVEDYEMARAAREEMAL